MSDRVSGNCLMLVAFALLTALICGCDVEPRQAELESGEVFSGGAASTQRQDANAFSMASTNLSPSRRMDFFVGNAFFRNAWVPGGSLPANRSGLGPLFNSSSCQGCHIKDGRGHPPVADRVGTALSTLVRLSVPAGAGSSMALLREGVVPEPTYGTQLQDQAVTGHSAEGQLFLRYQLREVRMADGISVQLRKPMLTLVNLGYGAMHPHTMMSMRVAPPMIGLGLLEAISPDELLTNIAQQERDGRVSGRLNQVWDVRLQQTVMGRFGWKAGQPNLEQQNASAFAGDMGLTTSLVRQDDCTSTQHLCVGDSADAEDVSTSIMASVLFYTRNLAVPTRREAGSSEVLRGKALFADIGCALCHRPSYVTAKAAEPELAGQKIFPYTDLLLHDMGEGLADGRSDFLATGYEWRTPPLWGIGLTERVSGHNQLLHDGRARNLLEAILWHGGEASFARDAVINLPTAQRESLLRFLESL